MNTNDQNTFQTSDIFLASTLTCLGHDLIEVDTTNPKRVGFCFDSNNKLQEDIQRFWRGKILVEPKRLFDSQRFLKARIYSS